MKINQNERIENKDFFFQKTPKQQFEQGRSVYFFSPTKSCNLLLPIQLPYNQTPRTFCPLVLPSSYVACISWPFMAVSASPIMSAFQQEGRKERRRKWPFLKKYFLEVAHITSIFIFLARSQSHSHIASREAEEMFSLSSVATCYWSLFIEKNRKVDVGR